jgi:tripartite-type tricarboxylate transporter receptor subunit TctC
MRTSPRRLGWILLLLVPYFAGCEGGPDGEYPNRPVGFIVPWNPGGGTDATSRALAASMRSTLGYPVNVVNRTGGGGVVGHLALSQARPDGYTIGAMTVEITMMHWSGLTPLTLNDYTPLALLVNNPAAVTVRADAPWSTLDELLDGVRESPGRFRASGTSRGGIWDLARVGFLHAAGLPESALPWVPSQGAAPALQQLVSGGVHVVTASLVEVNALRQAGQVRALAVMADTRLQSFPDVPTLREHGIDWSVGGWIAVAGPADLPEDIRARLVSAIEQAVTDPAYTASMTQAGFNLEFLAGPELDSFLREQDRLNGELMRSAGLVR